MIVGDKEWLGDIALDEEGGFENMMHSNQGVCKYMMLGDKVGLGKYDT